MEHYELLLIFKETYSDEEVPAVAARIHELVKKHGGVVTREEPFGRKRLAYAIRHNVHGVYYLLELDADPKSAKAFDHELRLHEDVVRHLITKKKVKTAEELEREQRLQERISRKRLEARRATESKEETPKMPPITIEELDKKLEEILEKPEAV